MSKPKKSKLLRSTVNAYKRKWEAWYLKERPVFGRPNTTRPPDPPKSMHGGIGATIRRAVARKHRPKIG